MRNAIIAGNWKMNKTPEEAKALVEALAPLVKRRKRTGSGVSTIRMLNSSTRSS